VDQETLPAGTEPTTLYEHGAPMTDITSKRLLYIKGALFVLTGTAATALILIRHPDLQLALLLAIAIWAFCRAYYFAFYVIEHYIDPTYRFAGLGSAIRYLRKERRKMVHPGSARVDLKKNADKLIL
jgi:hypothetical protein